MTEMEKKESLSFEKFNDLQMILFDVRYIIDSRNLYIYNWLIIC